VTAVTAATAGLVVVVAWRRPVDDESRPVEESVSS
jgi:hypothetical protein